ncbi:Major facilitator superfamily domain general substrate transporter [Penicillium chermesinum]|uniref:Major facilitator superfamily domain general substrate transporter n=1 Tax=Penicillium chermesinum TaxID=63820 RepID=A0A9W9N819_9EURO|nr:Major facilitator superfamily domain general substrate transporter [Penicillium chermesinum]KAJ5214965.1 Major facilitator superfamily domain general substrate transporter [Penicillium chermesinum]KAJ6141531.1 Major facilitator superfamily domain general substrate transporter [Penicillium chermesinum]
MGFFGKRNDSEDQIQEAAPEPDVEKVVPSAHQESDVGQSAAGPMLALPDIDPKLEHRVLRKLDLRLTTLVAFFYLLAFLDRSNIGNAKIAGMSTDLSLTGEKYTWLLTIFYISYAVFEFQAIMWKVVKPHQWCAFMVFSWGLVSTCQAATQNWQGMMALRFLMGIFEAGFGPGVPYLLSFFYRRHELGLRCGMYFAAAPLANTFAGALAYGITSGHESIASWRVLFLVEGLPVVASALLAWFFLPDSPATAKFLTEEEKEVTRIRAIAQSGEPDRKLEIQWKEVVEILFDPKAWLLSFMYFSCNVSFSSLSVFLPSILKEMGFTSIDAQGLTAPVFFASFLVTLATPWIADRLQQRGYMIAGLSLIGSVGYILCATVKTVGVRYFGVFVAACGVFPAIANLLPWVLNNQGSDSRRGAGIILMNLIGQCGPFLGTNVFPDSEAPRFLRGMWICAAFMLFNTFLALVLRFYLVWMNKGLDKKYGPKVAVDPSKKELSPEDNYGAGFRYAL